MAGQVSIWSVLWLKCTENGRWPPVISDSAIMARVAARIVSHTHTHTYRTQDLLYLVSSQTAFTWLTDNMYMCMRRTDSGEGPGRGLVSAFTFTWSTDDMRMRIGTGAGLIHVHLAGVGLIA